MSVPAILNAVVNRNQISSKWIAKETGKAHKHVLRDIEALRKEDGPNLDHLMDSRGYVKEYLLPIEWAAILLGRYTGPRAVAARRLIVEAVSYFIHRAPGAEQRIRDLEEELAWERAQKRRQALPTSQGPSKVLVRVLIDDVLPGFQPYYVNKYVSPESVPTGADEVAKLAHLRQTEAGLSKKRKKQEDFVLGGLN